jgi:hypothetical protein
MNQDLVDLLANITVASKINAGDVLRLRDEVWADEQLAQPVVEALFDLNDRCRDVVPEWHDFLYECVDHFLLHQTPPFGFLDEKGAAWLRMRVGRTGRIKSWFEMEMLVCLLEHSENAPDWLKVWALAQVEETVISGTGPTRTGQEPSPNRVDEAEVDLIRRLIFAEGGEGATIVGTAEADLLFRIKDKTLGSDNAPGWMTLFVQGVGNHLMAHSDYRPVTADEAARLNGFMEDHTPNLFGFLRRTLPGPMLGKGTVVEAFKAIFEDAPQHFGDEADIAESRTLTADEAAWLKQAIAADGQTDDYEKALLTFIIEETGNLPSMLESFRKRA